MALIVVIEGSPLMRPALRDLLQLGGHTVIATGRVINNAIKFCREKPPRVHASAEREGAAWAFAVQDSGIGIDFP